MSGPVSHMLLQRLAQPFSHPDWQFELKYDGFRALAFIVNRSCRLESRNRYNFKFQTLSESLAKGFSTADLILDGEIVCLDAQGKPQFNDLLFRRAEPRFVAFDLLYCNGADLRNTPLVYRKSRLKELLTGFDEPRLCYVDHLEEQGEKLFDAVCKLDLEGIVAKHRSGRYVSSREESTWFKIRNPNYSQMEGRHELFDREVEKPHSPDWADCTRAVAMAAGE